MCTLYLPLKKEWFEKIESGEKTVEYREFEGYWIRRLKRTEQYFRGADCMERLAKYTTRSNSRSAMAAGR